MIKSFWRHVTYNYREGGIRQIIQKIFWRLRHWLWSEASWLIYGQDLENFSAEPRLPLTDIEASFDTLRELGYFKAQAFPEMVWAALDRGSRCHACVMDGKLVNIGWTSRDVLELESGVRLQEEGCIAISDCLTLPEFRSRGIYADSLIRMMRRGRDQGAARAVIGVDPGNIPSIRAIEKVGFRPLYRLTAGRRFGRRFSRKSEFQAQFDNKLGAQS